MQYDFMTFVSGVKLVIGYLTLSALWFFTSQLAHIVLKCCTSTCSTKVLKLRALLPSGHLVLCSEKMNSSEGELLF